MGVGGDIEPVPKISSDRINRAREWPPTLCEDEPVFAVFAKLHDSSLSGVEDMAGPPPGSGCWNGSHALCAPTFHGRRTDLGRSEERPSELQSLMRTSYAVFCLKKKNITNATHTN